LETATIAGASGQPQSLYSAAQHWRFLTVLFLVRISSNFDYYVLGVVLDPIKHEFGVSDTALGVLSGSSFAVCYAIAALPFARWSDRGNRRTVITVALAGWSLMTIWCGVAQSFVQLLLARFGVGAMEPGATPAGQSLISDYFPPERRGSAISVTLAGDSAGYLLGIALGGYIAATRGWRSAFIYAGVLGLILAVIARLTLIEPRHQLGFPQGTAQTESWRHAISQLLRKRSFVCTIIGMSGYIFFIIGTGTFVPSYLIRIMHVPLAQASVTWGIATASAKLIGTLCGGWLADRLSRRDIRWYAWLPAILCALSTPLYWLAFSATRLWTFIPIDFVAELFLGIGTVSAWPAVHAICGNRRRAMAIAVMLFAYILFGVGFGPTVVGVLSDAFGTTYGGLQSLRYSLNAVTLILIPTAVAFYWAGHTMRRELEN
jgi:predicted MFS family arabinose efflux permease